MRPAIEPGDWLLVDPTITRWPRRGSVVVFREPGSDRLVLKRVAARGGDTVTTPLGRLRLAADEAWLVGESPESHDSRHYGPVTLDRLVGRAWLRYAPLDRLGLLGRRGGRRAGRGGGPLGAVQAGQGAGGA